MKDLEQKLVDFRQSRMANSKSILDSEEAVRKLKAVVDEQERLIKKTDEESSQLRAEFANSKISNELDANKLKLEVCVLINKLFYLLKIIIFVCFVD
jgi:hypothetical protein